MNRNLRDILVRAGKTFAQAAVGVIIAAVLGVPTTTLLITAAIVGVVAALISFAQNLLGISPTSIPGRAAQTFVQTFGAVLVATGYVVNQATLVAALAGALSATVNYVKEANL